MFDVPYPTNEQLVCKTLNDNIIYVHNAADTNGERIPTFPLIVLSVDGDSINCGDSDKNRVRVFLSQRGEIWDTRKDVNRNIAKEIGRNIDRWN